MLNFVLSLFMLSSFLLLSPAEKKYKYEDFQSPKACAPCHIDISRQWEQAMMSECFTHEWDEIEYFQLALPHSEKEPKVAEVKEGCNGCHAPLAFLTGDIPPQPPSKGTRANESVSCDICHTITGFEGDTPFNFNWKVSPGRTKQGSRPVGVESPFHNIVENKFLKTAEFCGTCHNEKDPYGQWVKATHLEWKEGPYGKAGIVCQNCHMPPAFGKSANIGKDYPDVRQHLFHGAHDLGKLSGAVEVRVHSDIKEAEPGETVKITATVVNAKAGHKIPTGSAEERVLWLHLEAKDSKGKIYHIPVDRKGFEGEDFTIASSTALAYQDMGEVMGLKDFKGLKRDGFVPEGDRIFRLPYLDPKGRMTIMQWYTASFGPDYRIGPLEAKNETFTFKIPENAEGEIIFEAQIWYSRLISSVAEFLKVPKEEYEPVLISTHKTKIKILD